MRLLEDIGETMLEDTLETALNEELVAQIDEVIIEQLRVSQMDRDTLQQEYISTRTALKSERERNAQMSRTIRLVNEVLSENNISLWGIRAESKLEMTDEVKESLANYLSLGHAVSTLDEAISENPAAADYWRRMLISLKLGDETGKFKGIL